MQQQNNETDEINEDEYEIKIPVLYYSYNDI